MYKDILIIVHVSESTQCFDDHGRYIYGMNIVMLIATPDSLELYVRRPQQIKI
jgi:hypothetical protein